MYNLRDHITALWSVGWAGVGSNGIMQLIFLITEQRLIISFLLEFNEQCPPALLLYPEDPDQAGYQGPSY